MPPASSYKLLPLPKEDLPLFEALVLLKLFFDSEDRLAGFLGRLKTVCVSLWLGSRVIQRRLRVFERLDARLLCALVLLSLGIVEKGLFAGLTEGVAFFTGLDGDRAVIEVNEVVHLDLLSGKSHERHRRFHLDGAC